MDHSLRENVLLEFIVDTAVDREWLSSFVVSVCFGIILE